MAGNNRNSNRWHHAMFENPSLGIVYLDKTDFTIQNCNAAFSSFLDYNPEELQGRIFTSLFVDHKEENEFLTRTGEDHSLSGFEVRLETKEGNECRAFLFGNLIEGKTFCCMAVTNSFSEISKKTGEPDYEQYHRFAKSLPTGILIVKKGKILYVNPAFLLFSGYQKDEILGTDLLSLADEPDRINLKELTDCGSGEIRKAGRKEVRLVTKYGNKRMVLLFTHPIKYSGGPAVLINFVDISEKQLLEDRIQLDNERRRGIIVTVAHELRTPLQPILGYLNLLIQDPEEFGILEDTKKILERCLASVDRERQIINQMLELSVLESGKLQLNFSKFLLSALVTSILDTGGYGEKAEISTDIPPNLIISADIDRLFGVVDSLLSNAVNFSTPPRIIAIFYHSDTDDAFHHISIRDNGSGIPRDALASIFEPFQLADAVKLSRRFDRIGLSLSMAKKIMQMHGGDVTVESVLHTGSIFTLHLPKSGQDET
jgi:PAS domain S-box-containing protein